MTSQEPGFIVSRLDDNAGDVNAADNWVEALETKSSPQSKKGFFFLWFPFLAMAGGITGVVLCRPLDFCSMCGMGLWGLVLGSAFGGLYKVAEKLRGGFDKNVRRLTLVGFFLAFTTFGFFALYRPPGTVFRREFGFDKPRSVKIEHVAVFPNAMDYFWLMKLSAPADFVKKIILDGAYEEKAVKRYEDGRVRFMLQTEDGVKEVGFGGDLSLRETYDWWRPNEIDKVRLFWHKKKEGGMRIIYWDEDANLVYYVRSG